MSTSESTCGRGSSNEKAAFTCPTFTSAKSCGAASPAHGGGADDGASSARRAQNGAAVALSCPSVTGRALFEGVNAAASAEQAGPEPPASAPASPRPWAAREAIHLTCPCTASAKSFGSADGSSTPSSVHQAGRGVPSAAWPTFVWAPIGSPGAGGRRATPRANDAVPATERSAETSADASSATVEVRFVESAPMDTAESRPAARTSTASSTSPWPYGESGRRAASRERAVRFRIGIAHLAHCPAAAGGTPFVKAPHERSPSGRA